MLIDFNHAKKVAAGCAALTGCSFLLWVNQNNVYADVNQNASQNVVVAQQETSQVAPEAQVQNRGGRKPILMTGETTPALTKHKSMLMAN